MSFKISKDGKLIEKKESKPIKKTKISEQPNIYRHVRDCGNCKNYRFLHGCKLKRNEERFDSCEFFIYFKE